MPKSFLHGQVGSDPNNTAAVKVNDEGRILSSGAGGGRIVEARQLNGSGGPIVRPANTTDYDPNEIVGDVSNNILQLDDMAVEGGMGGYIVGGRFATNTNNIAARFRLHLFNTIDVDLGPLDQANFVPQYTDAQNYLGFVEYGPLVTGNGASYFFNKTERLRYNCRAGETSLWAILQTLDTFTPIASQQFWVSVFTTQD